ncbi:hypothetical protein DVF53_24815 [Salmonella enterica subsp. enterica serovar Kottbus]|nr:hypothetical protein [Salmonella enterica subsp. enterica serovar Kottbus]
MRLRPQWWIAISGYILFMSVAMWIQRDYQFTVISLKKYNATEGAFLWRCCLFFLNQFFILDCAWNNVMNIRLNNDAQNLLF